MAETPTDVLVRRARRLVQEARDRLDADKKIKGSYGGPKIQDLTSFMLALEAACDDVEGIKVDAVRKPFKAQTVQDGSWADGEQHEEHESFGLALLTRRSHSGPGTHLFGSALDKHPTTIVLSILRGQRIHSNLAYDRYFPASGANHIVDVELSAAQFANLITNPNMGVGFPCTLREVAGITMEGVPYEHTSEQKKIVETFQRDVKDVAATVKPQVDEARAILAKKSLGKADRERLASIIQKIVRLYSDKAPHVAEMFNEATDTMLTHAKAEVEAYATAVIHSAGLESLRSKQEAGVPSIIDTSTTRKIEGEGNG